MSDEEDRTEHVSERRLRLAFEEGQVPVGRDAVATAGVAAGTMVLATTAPRLRDALVHLVEDSVGGAAHADFNGIVGGIAKASGWAALACCAVALVGALTTLAQTRAGFWPQLALPDLTRLSGGRLSRLFKREFAVDLALAIVKVLAVGAVAYLSLRDDFLALPGMLEASPIAQLGHLFRPLGKAAVKVVAMMGVLAGAELALTHFRFNAKMKMTKEEAKREMKEDEGDPLLRSRRKRRHRELAKGRATMEVPRADAIIVNPTHVAIAIRYRREEGRAPRVTAKGKGQLAEIMRDLARSNGIPIVEDIYLARLLHRRVKVGGQIPAETYRAVAAILAYVYRVTGHPSASAGGSP